ncbi:FAD-dependent oxidoreductase [Falsochrobactrum sp. TDYN1]|uniref:FAD-dependent oxidoreductase n=1 Tax=Falsochrobactrum tianjinense TaxID=2706015 RepID=A0A949PNT8_9HYPH|nr:FAD-dependent oxidoreductase [Falsochrobactrum sp. TDYN1]MBV2142145.1 FAD-dependent oxidoreductase [Falsochrobactrum sp. TDYN1]
MFEVDWKTPHLWAKTTPKRSPAPELRGDHEADLLVVGGGYTGMAAALGARDSGANVILLEGNEIGSSASGRNHGLVISHHSKAAPSEFEAVYGKARGEKYNRLIANSGDVSFGLMQRFGINAHQVQNGWIQPAHTQATLRRVRQFYHEWKAFGAKVTWLDRDMISAKIGSPYLGGWLVPNSGHINPFAMAVGLAGALEREGVAIFENSKAISLKKSGKGWLVKTSKGSVIASRVVLATNALTDNLWPDLKRTLIPLKVFQSATEPLPEELRAQILLGNPAVSDMRNDLRYFHFDCDNRLVSGGTHTFWHNEAERGREKVATMLKKAFHAFKTTPKMVEYWHGTFAVVPDRRPRLYRLAPGLVFGGIYSGRGVALSMSLGQEIGRWALDQLSDDAMPLPVTNMQPVPFHPVATQVANRIHPWHRLKDRFE